MNKSYRFEIKRSRLIADQFFLRLVTSKNHAIVFTGNTQPDRHIIKRTLERAIEAIKKDDFEIVDELEYTGEEWKGQLNGR